MNKLDTERTLIKSIEFDLFSPEEIKRVSTTNVTESSQYIGGYPTISGPNDFRMGSIDRRLKCATCKRSVITCPGHFGVINLNYPVLHPGFIDVILKLVRCVCFFCSEPLLFERDKAALRKIKDRKQRLAAAALSAKMKKTCPACGGKQPQYNKAGLVIKCDWSRVSFDDPEEESFCMRPFTSAEIRLILKHIKDETYHFLMANPRAVRPECLVLTTFVVVPPIVRPSITVSEGSRARGQDDLTAKISDLSTQN